MKISAVYTPSVKDRIHTDTEKKILLINFSFLISGIAVGCIVFMLNREVLSETMNGLFEQHLISVNSSDFNGAILGFVCAHIVFYALIIILSTSVFGFALSGMLGLYKTLGLGFFVTYLYWQFGLRGIEYSLLVVFPGKFLLLFSVLIMMVYSEKMSLTVMKSAKGESKEKASGEPYLKLGLGVLLYIISVIADLFIFKSFAGLFDFF